MRAIDLTGTVVGRWTVEKRAPNTARGDTCWVCRCACGARKTLRGITLRDGRSRSCGCLRSEVTTAQSTKHGHSPGGEQPSRTYQSWVAMHARCGNPKNKDFHNYGARGITVCARWRTFARFLADMGVRPRAKTLDRIDGDKGYRPSNCRWATPLEQRHNRRASLTGS